MTRFKVKTFIFLFIFWISLPRTEKRIKVKTFFWSYGEFGARIHIVNASAANEQIDFECGPRAKKFAHPWCLRNWKNSFQ